MLLINWLHLILLIINNKEHKYIPPLTMPIWLIMKITSQWDPHPTILTSALQLASQQHSQRSLLCTIVYHANDLFDNWYQLTRLCRLTVQRGVHSWYILTIPLGWFKCDLVMVRHNQCIGSLYRQARMWHNYFPIETMNVNRMSTIVDCASWVI
jgi:hypothetical protein